MLRNPQPTLRSGSWPAAVAIGASVVALAFWPAAASGALLSPGGGQAPEVGQTPAVLSESSQPSGPVGGVVNTVTRTLQDPSAAAAAPSEQGPVEEAQSAAGSVATSAESTAAPTISVAHPETSAGVQSGALREVASHAQSVASVTAHGSPTETDGLAGAATHAVTGAVGAVTSSGAVHAVTSSGIRSAVAAGAKPVIGAATALSREVITRGAGLVVARAGLSPILPAPERIASPLLAPIASASTTQSTATGELAAVVPNALRAKVGVGIPTGTIPSNVTGLTALAALTGSSGSQTAGPHGNGYSGPGAGTPELGAHISSGSPPIPGLTPAPSPYGVGAGTTTHTRIARPVSGHGLEPSAPSRVAGPSVSGWSTLILPDLPAVSGEQGEHAGHRVAGRLAPAPPTGAPAAPIPSGGAASGLAPMSGLAFSDFLILGSLLALGAPRGWRRLRLASGPPRRAPFLGMPERPG